MNIEIRNGAQAVAEVIAVQNAAEGVDSLAGRGRCIMLVGVSDTPCLVLRALAKVDRRWLRIEVFLVDERVAHDSNADQNLTQAAKRFRVASPCLRAKRIQRQWKRTPRNVRRPFRRVAGTRVGLDLIGRSLGRAVRMPPRQGVCLSTYAAVDGALYMWVCYHK